MIVKKEKYYEKRINETSRINYDVQRRKRVSYLLFGIIPIFITDEVINGSYEKIR